MGAGRVPPPRTPHWCPESQHPVNRKIKEMGEEQEVASGVEGYPRPGEQEWRAGRKVVEWGDTNGNSGCGERT